LTFYPPKKYVLLPLIRVEKNSSNWAYRVSKEAEFCADLKKSRSLEFGKREIFYRETELGLGKFSKKLFF
jgi:hypothetical protein